MVRNRKGLAVLALIWPLWVTLALIAGTLIEFGAMFYDLAVCHDCGGFAGNGDGGRF
jgi:hypothetical protein